MPWAIVAYVPMRTRQCVPGEVWFIHSGLGQKQGVVMGASVGYRMGHQRRFSVKTAVNDDGVYLFTSTARRFPLVSVQKYSRM
ncbi:MAG: hypothetical protein EA427_13435 [Spirochaetaceae bacterium]|nr:MAG: hypothetical protein EA427_13435 [Spirochaetaceae bacterium]